MPPTKINLKLSETTPLKILKQHVANEINPKNTKIDLMWKGNFLKNDNLNLKALDFSKLNSNHIFVTDKEEENN